MKEMSEARETLKNLLTPWGSPAVVEMNWREQILILKIRGRVFYVENFEVEEYEATK